MTEEPLQSLLDQRRQFLGFVERRVNDAAAAEDILQAAYMRAVQHGGELREGESAVAWFYRILRNAIIDHYRRRATESSVVEQGASDPDSFTAPEAGLHRAVCACVDHVVDRLNPGYAALLRAVDLDEQPLSEFARQNNITPGNAAVRAHRARTALRKELIRTCGVCAEHACLDCFCRSSASADRAAAK